MYGGKILVQEKEEKNTKIVVYLMIIAILASTLFAGMAMFF